MILRDLTQDLDAPGRRQPSAGALACSDGQIDPYRLHKGPHHSGPRPFSHAALLSVTPTAVCPQTASSDNKRPC